MKKIEFLANLREPWRQPTLSRQGMAFSGNGWGFPIKKGDPRNPIITCSIGPHTFHNSICDLGSSVNIISKETYDRLFYSPLASTSIYLQLADQSTRYPEGVPIDLLVKVRSAYVPTDFMILDIGNYWYLLTCHLF